MAKYDTTFTLKCDEDFKYQLRVLSRHHKESDAWILRNLVNIAFKELRCQS